MLGPCKLFVHMFLKRLSVTNIAFFNIWHVMGDGGNAFLAQVEAYPRVTLGQINLTPVSMLQCNAD